MSSLLLKQPVIGISASVATIETGPLIGRERAFLGQDYVNAVVESGGLPLILPIIGNPLPFLALVDGLIISGGYDIDPELYGEEPNPLLETTCRKRDIFEMALIREADAKGIPVLGICRGLQLMNVVFGGSLYQDLSLSSLNLLQHRQKTSLDEGSHFVDLEEGSFLRQVYGVSAIRTNSLHHQSIKSLAQSFEISAKSRDGIIEAIERNEKALLIGLQWHPELMFASDEPTRRMFINFINACKEKSSE